MPNSAEQDSTAATLPPTQHVGMEGVQIARGGAVVLFSTLVAQAIGMITTIWFARALGPDQFGVFSLGLSVLLPVVALAAIGLRKTVVRFLPIHVELKENRQVAGVLFSALSMSAVSSLVAAAALVLLAPFLSEVVFHEPRLTPVLRALALTVPLAVFIDVAVAATRGLKVMHFDGIIKIARPLSRLVVWAIAIVAVSQLLAAAVLATIVSTLLTALLAGLLLYIAYRSFIRDGVQWSFKPLFVYSLPLTLSTLMYTLAPRIDRLTTGIVAQSDAVGKYAAAASLVAVLSLIHSSITMAFAPVMADAYNRVSTDRAGTLYLLVTHWDSRVTFLVVVGALLLAQEVLGLFGEQYAGGITVFLILAVSVHLSTLPGPTGSFLQMTNRQRVDAYNALAFFIIGPVLQLTFASILGWTGIAVGVLATTLIINSLQVVEIRHIYGFHPFAGDHGPFALVSTVTVLICAYAGATGTLPQRVALLLFVCLAFGLFMLVAVNDSDRRFLASLLKQRPRR